MVMNVVMLTCRREDVIQETLISLIQSGNIIGVGVTTVPDTRISTYQSQGYIGTMYVAKTKNMKQAENRLLEACQTCQLNVQRSSNVRAEDGYVYVIKGHKK